MTPIIPLLCMILFAYAIIRSARRLRTTVYGLLAVVLSVCAVYGLTVILHLNEEIMGHVAVPVMFVVAAYVAWTHARTTRKVGAQNDSPGDTSKPHA